MFKVRAEVGADSGLEALSGGMAHSMTILHQFLNKYLDSRHGSLIHYTNKK